nr:protein PF14_0175-like [Dermatophagoides farinae]
MVDDQKLYANNNNHHHHHNNNNNTTASRLPRSLTLSCKKLSTSHNNSPTTSSSSSSMKIYGGEPFFDAITKTKTKMASDQHEQNNNIDMNISPVTSTTASLSLISSNMNDAILNVMNDDDDDVDDNVVVDDDDYHDDDNIIDVQRGRLLTAIDESSLSPLPSLNSIINCAANESNDNNSTPMNGVENNNNDDDDDAIIMMMTDEKSVDEPVDDMIIEPPPPQPSSSLLSLKQDEHQQPESVIMDDEESEVLSLNSIDIIQETNNPDSLSLNGNVAVDDKNESKSLMNKRTNKSTKSTEISKIKSIKRSTSSSSSTTTKTLLNVSTALMKTQSHQNRLITKKSVTATRNNIDYLNRKNFQSKNGNNNCFTSSSKPCSTNVSRCTTPALSETDSVCSSLSTTTNPTRTKRSTKMLTNSVQNVNNKRPYSSSIRNVHHVHQNRTITTNHSHPKIVNNTNDANGGGGVGVGGGMKKSTTYTRLTQTNVTSSSSTTRKENVNPLIMNTNDMIITGTGSNITGKNPRSFAKPTASYLRKATTNNVATLQTSSALSNIGTTNGIVSASSSSSSSIPSSVTKTASLNNKSNVGNGSSSHAFTAKRSPTITLLNSLAQSNAKSTSNSANSSRRSSIASPTKPQVNLNSSKKDILQQLQYYENLCYDRLQLIEKKALELKQLSSKTNGFLTLFSFLLTEYRPFDTPKLRAELLAAHQKCSNLHRDYELAKEITNQKQTEINLLMTNVDELNNVIEDQKVKIVSIENHYIGLKQAAESFDDERKRLQNELQETQDECTNEKEIRVDLEKRLEKAEGLLKSDRKYRELKEKISNYEKEVDSLNVVVDMKTQRIRYLESEKMRTELELADYEQLKESYQQLQRENEALTEALGMKARKNAEQSRELDILRTELKRETNERKRLAARYDTLEFQFNESRDMLTSMNAMLNEESMKNAETDETVFFTPMQSSNNSNFVESSRKSRPGSNSNAVRQLFSTPLMSDPQFKSRYHFQHQDPASDASHRLPEVVLSSIKSSNCRSFHNKRNASISETNTATNGHQSSSSSSSSFHQSTKIHTHTHHNPHPHPHHHHNNNNHHHQDIDPISTDSSLASSNSEERESNRFSE